MCSHECLDRGSAAEVRIPREAPGDSVHFAVPFPIAGTGEAAGQGRSDDVRGDRLLRAQLRSHAGCALGRSIGQECSLVRSCGSMRACSRGLCHGFPGRRSVEGIQCLFQELRQGLACIAAKSAQTRLVVMNVVEEASGQ